MLTKTELNFKIKDSIGEEGKNSEVFIAKDIQMDANIVIKRIPKSSLNEKDFFLEAKCLYSSSHENVVPIYYSCKDDRYIYIAMPFFKKGSLSSILNTNSLTVREIINYSIDFLTGLNHIHTKRLIHADIKPTNILISNSGKALLTDFGLSRFLDSNGIAEFNTIYSPHIAPEQLRTNHSSIETDIYQAGLTLYRMCDSRNYFINDFKNICSQKNPKGFLKEQCVSGQFPNRELYDQHIPQKLRKVIKKMINIDVEKRYSNVLSILNDLSLISDNLDWKLESNHNDMVEWSCVKEDKKYKVTCKSIENRYSIVTKRINLDTNRETKMSKYCYENIESKCECDKNLSSIFGSI